MFHKNTSISDSKSNKILLKNDWDSFPSLSESKADGHYIGREIELNQFVHWLKHKSGGSALISGVRGIGKSAFVSQAIVNATKTKKPRWLIMLMFWEQRLNPVIVTSGESTLTKEGLLNTTIRAYCTDELGEPNSKELLKLTYAEDKSCYKESSLRDNSFQINPSIQAIVYVLVLIVVNYFSSEYILRIIHNYLPNFNTGNGNLIFPITTFAVSLLGIRFSQKIINKSENEIQIKSNSPDYLASRFNKVLERKKHETTIFIIDELDKLGSDEQNYEKIVDLIGSIKNLITISRAKFIFITSESFYEKLHKMTVFDGLSNKLAIRYPKESTFFNIKFFLDDIRPPDIEVYINEISEAGDVDQYQSEIRLLSYYLYFKSAGVFSKVKEVIRDFVLIDNGNAYIMWSKFNDEMRRVARLTQIYTFTLSRFRKPLISDNEYNQLLHEILFPILQGIVDGNGTYPNSPDLLVGWVLPEMLNILPANRQIEISQILIAWIKNIYRYGGHKLTETTNVKPDLTNPYQLIISFDLIEPSIIPGFSVGAMTPEEENLLLKQKKLTQMLTPYKTYSVFDSIYDKLLLPIRSIENNAEKEARKITQNLDLQGEIVEPIDLDNIHLLNSEIDKTDEYLHSISVAALFAYFKENLIQFGIQVKPFAMKKLDMSGEELPHGFELTYVSRGNVLSKTRKVTVVDYTGSKEVRGLADRRYFIVADKKELDIKDEYKRVSIQSENALKNVVESIFSSLVSSHKLLILDSFALEHKPNDPHGFDYKLLNTSQKTVRYLRFDASSSDSYWRIGAVFGATSNTDIEPGWIDNREKFTTVHIYKDTSDDQLRYRLIASNQARGHEIIDPLDVDGQKVSEKMSFIIKNLKTDMGRKELIVNDKTIRKWKETNTQPLFNKAIIAAWGDGHPFIARFSNVVAVIDK